MHLFTDITRITSLIFIRDKKQRSLFILVLLTISLTSIGSALFPLFFSWAIDALTDNSAPSRAIEYILIYGLGLIIVGILEQLQWLSFGPMNLRLQRHLTVYVFDHAVSLPYYRLKSYTTYELGRTIERGLDAIRNITSNLAFFLIPTLLELIIAASVIAYKIDIWIAVILFTALIIYGYLANVSADRIRKATEKAMDTGIDAWGFGLDGVANAELVQQANMSSSYIQTLNDKLKLNDKAWTKTFKQRCLFGSLQALVFGSVVLGVLYRGTADVISGTLSIGELVLLSTYIIRLLQPVETFARVYREVHASMGETKLLSDLLAIKVPKADGEHALIPIEPFAISFEKVSLSVNNRSMLSGLNFSVPKGSILYVVGPSGSGKSSLLKIMSCLSLTEDGHYKINGQEITEETAAAFRSHIAVVQQDCLLFDWSIRDNINFGIKATNVEIDRIIALLGLDVVSERHSELSQATVGERGNRLSGGEKQRISLARALLRKPNLLLLDEPTAALDEVNRKRVLTEIQRAQTTCTIVMVTHDISLLDDSSTVLFLNFDGSHFLGKHYDLISSEIAYKNFINGILADR